MLASNTVNELTSSAKKPKLEDDKDLVGFDASEIEFAEKYHQNFLSINTKLGKCSAKTMPTLNERVMNDKRNHIHENNKDYNDVELTKTCNRKRKADANNTPADAKSSTVRDEEVLLANVFISKTSRECNFKSDATRIGKISTTSMQPWFFLSLTRISMLSSSFFSLCLFSDNQISSKSSLEKQRQKTRYSNDDLFKPRPLLGGVSRRRRGFNCNE